MQFYGTFLRLRSIFKWVLLAPAMGAGDAGKGAGLWRGDLRSRSLKFQKSRARWRLRATNTKNLAHGGAAAPEISKIRAETKIRARATNSENFTLGGASAPEISENSRSMALENSKNCVRARLTRIKIKIRARAKSLFFWHLQWAQRGPRGNQRRIANLPFRYRAPVSAEILK